MAASSKSQNRRRSRSCRIFLELLESRYAPAGSGPLTMLAHSTVAPTTDSVLRAPLVITSDHGAANPAPEKPGLSAAGSLAEGSNWKSPPAGNAGPAVLKRPDNDGPITRKDDDDADDKGVFTTTALSSVFMAFGTAVAETGPRLVTNGTGGLNAAPEGAFVTSLPIGGSKGTEGQPSVGPGPAVKHPEFLPNSTNEAPIPGNLVVSLGRAIPWDATAVSGIFLPGPHAGALVFEAMPLNVAALERALRDFVDSAKEIQQTLSCWLDMPSTWAWLCMGSAIMVVGGEAIHRRLARRIPVQATMSMCELALRGTEDRNS